MLEDGEFGFVVLASPEEIQISLDKRDGSHWELFNCSNAVSEEEQTIRMMCTDLSESSNCDKIYLGHGAPGTIVEMPKGVSSLGETCKGVAEADIHLVWTRKVRSCQIFGGVT